MRQLPRLKDDGLPAPEVGRWAEQKYRLVATYAGMFATGMKRKWDKRIYIDLFAGAGRSRIERTQSRIEATPLLVLGLPDPFDLHVFCDIDQAKLDALEQRTRIAGQRDRCRFRFGDVNDRPEGIPALVKKEAGRARFLTFCVVDPFSLGNLKFATIKAVVELYVDFLVLVPSYMDAHRNEKRYLEGDATPLDGFLGDGEWREAWRNRTDKRGDFGMFVADEFGERMKHLGYKYTGLHR